jgi:hypothetical protein
MDFKNKIDELFMDMVKASLAEDNTNDKSDDGDGLDKVQPKAVKKKFKDRKDKDIDNDGDVDDSDEYLHKRRKAVSKAIANEEIEESIAGAIIGGVGGALAGKAAQAAVGKAAGKIAGKAGAGMLGRAAARAAATKYAPAAGAAIGAVAGHQATKKRKNEDLEESEVEEGKRGFIMAAKAAKEKGEKTFMFAGKEYETENMKEFHAPGMAPKGRAKAKPASTKKSLADIRNKADNFKKKVKDSAVELDEESSTIAKVKEIVAKKSAMKIDGVMVDMFTASAIAQIYDKVNDANKKKMDGLKITKLADVAMKLMKREELEEKTECPKCEGKGCDHCDNTGYHEEKVAEAKNYEYKDGKVHISKANFRKVHRDFKNATKGKERMMILDPKTQASISVPVVFTESNFRETFRNSISKRLSESAKTEEKSDEVANRYNELKQLAPVELTKLYMKHHEDADMDSVKKMEKSQMISAIIEKEMGGKDAEPESED